MYVFMNTIVDGTKLKVTTNTCSNLDDAHSGAFKRRKNNYVRNWGLKRGEGVRLKGTYMYFQELTVCSLVVRELLWRSVVHFSGGSCFPSSTSLPATLSPLLLPSHRIIPPFSGVNPEAQVPQSG